MFSGFCVVLNFGWLGRLLLIGDIVYKKGDCDACSNNLYQDGSSPMLISRILGRTLSNPHSFSNKTITIPCR
jgi:hypothetical protein